MSISASSLICLREEYIPTSQNIIFWSIKKKWETIFLGLSRFRNSAGNMINNLIDNSRYRFITNSDLDPSKVQILVFKYIYCLPKNDFSDSSQSYDRGIYHRMWSYIGKWLHQHCAPGCRLDADPSWLLRVTFVYHPLSVRHSDRKMQKHPGKYFLWFPPFRC